MNKDKIKSFFKKFFFSYYWLMVLIFAIDIVSKWVVEKNLVLTTNYDSDGVTLIPNFLYICKSYNVGMAWSIGADGKIISRAIFIAISVIIGFGLLIYYIIKFKEIKNWVKVSLALMIAGAFGNLIDRAFYWESLVGFNGVIDWIKVIPFGYDFPMFNIADASLVVGVIILLILMVIDLIKDAKEKSKKGEFKYSPDELKKLNEQNNENQNN